MCFTIDENHRRRKTAKEDITCYKVLIDREYQHSNYYSPYYGYKYVLGKLVKSRLQRPDRHNDINKGLHSHSTLKNANVCRDYFDVIVTCTIPKGAKYYYNHIKEEYVSNRLIAVERIK